jgi:geranylgeranyl diphosphate synthase, type II
MLKKYHTLNKHLSYVEKAIEKAILQMGNKSILRDACEFSLKSGGKRFRPILVLLISEAIGKGFETIDAALSAEFFHTASLIADDLPCMDNETYRREKKALHIAFSESTAILTSYTLIAAGYERIYKNSNILSKCTSVAYGNEICMQALKTVSACAGINGATNGQFLDLNSPNADLDTLIKIIEQKTVTLFEISCLLGWMFGGGELTKIAQVKECSYNLGMAFQIADDINDIKDNHDHTNICKLIGINAASEMFERHFKAFQDNLISLKLKSKSMIFLSEILWDMAKSAKISV